MPSISRRVAGGGAGLVREVQEGELLGCYQLEQLLGEGSMGRVFQARHVRLGRQVALKVLRPAIALDSHFVRRFFQEARAVNQINHEHIVEIFDFVEDVQRGHVYCVMELLRGQSVASLLKQEPLPLARIRRIMVQVCAALWAAHQLGVVHRDIKPDNLFVTQRAGQDFVKVLDFGVAKVPAADATTGTLDGTLVGTPAYMAPEQAAGLPVDHRADIYAVGTVLYEMLSGRAPFTAPVVGQLMVKVMTELPPPLPTHLPSGEPLPPDLAALALRCLAKEPAERPQQLTEVITALLMEPVQRLAGEVESRRITQSLPRLDEAHGGRWRAWLAAVVGGLSLVGGGLALESGVGAEAPLEREVRLDPPVVLEAPRIPVPPASQPREGAPVPARTLPGAHKAGMRDAVLNPFER